MEVVQNLTRTTLEEIEKVLSTKTVVGEPIAVEGATLIPLVSVGFGFGALEVVRAGERLRRKERALVVVPGVLPG